VWEIAPRVWDRKFVIYIISCLGMALTIEIIKSCAFQVDRICYINFDIGFAIALVILNLASIIIMIATLMIVVKKLCSITLREHEFIQNRVFDK
jgi:hypothetical protein